jgi:hypothetical protein
MQKRIKKFKPGTAKGRRLLRQPNLRYWTRFRQTCKRLDNFFTKECRCSATYLVPLPLVFRFAFGFKPKKNQKLPEEEYKKYSSGKTKTKSKTKDQLLRPNFFYI